MEPTPSSPKPILLVAAGRTDQGRVRPNNEDALLIGDLASPMPDAVGGVAHAVSRDITAHGALLVVSDGMGGTPAGEVASAMVVKLLADGFCEPGPVDLDGVGQIVRSVNRQIWDASKVDGRRGMGATMTALYFLGDEVFIAQVGDSRAYLLRCGRLRQLTHDQSRVQRLLDAGVLTREAAAQHPERNMVLQAMGTGPDVAVALARMDLRQGDRLLLCSDGLSNKVSDDELQAALGRAEPLEAIAASLVADANARGGEDNITVTVCSLAGPGLAAPDAGPPRAIPPPLPVAGLAAADALFERLIDQAYKLNHAGAYAPSVEVARQAIARARELGSVGLELRATRIEGCALALMGRDREAIERLDWSLGKAAERPRCFALTDTRVAHAVVSTLLDWVGYTDFAGPYSVSRRLEVLDRAEALVAEIGRPSWSCGVLSMRATLMRSVSRLDEAIALGAEGIRRFEQGAPGSNLASHRQQQADILYEAGRVDGAEKEYAAILADGRRSVRDEKSAHVGLARCALHRGDVAAARRRAERAVQIGRPLGDSAMCGALDVLALVLERAGELDHATAVADQLIERARRCSPIRLFAAVGRQIELAFKRADHDGTRQWLEQAAALARLLDAAAGGNRYARQLQDRRARLGA